MKLSDTYFEKVSWNQFKKDCKGKVDLDDEALRKCYDKIKLPERGTAGSAGYDFFVPFDTTFTQLTSNVIPTGIRCHMDNDVYLGIYPRSGIGFKTGMHLANTVGIIDSDYYNADNEGHIMVKMVNDCMLAHDYPVKRGHAFCQGIFHNYGVIADDNSNGERTGGFGSTDS